MKSLTVLLICFNISTMGYSQATPESNKRAPIIDMHMHTGLPHPIPPGTPAICRPDPCVGEGVATVDQDELLDKTLAMMKRHNIVKGFLSGVDVATLKQWHEAGEGRFIASPFILKPEAGQLEQIKAAYQAGTLEGMGEIGAQLMGIAPNDPALDPYFKLASERDLPVLIHTLGIGPYMPHFRSAAGSPLLLEEVLLKYPRLRLFIENAGYPYRDQMIAIMYQYPQLYVDVSTITWVIPRAAFYDYLQALMTAGLGKRIMFGSDQMVWPEKIAEAIAAIEEAPFLSASQKRDILYNNAARFLRLDEESSALENQLQH